MLLFKGEIIGVQKSRYDHWTISREGDYLLKLHKKDLISKWIIDNTNKLQHEIKGEKTDCNVVINVNFITRRKRSIDNLLKGFYKIVKTVYLKDTNQIVKINASYEISKSKKAITTFSIYEYNKKT